VRRRHRRRGWSAFADHDGHPVSPWGGRSPPKGRAGRSKAVDFVRPTRLWAGQNCQTACKPGSVRALRRWTAIPLGRALLRASRDQPGRRRGNAPGPGFRRTCRPYSVLLPVGFTLPPPLPAARCALAAPFHPCPWRRVAQARRAVCFLWHCPWGRPRRPLAGTVFPWSPDFPPPPVPFGAGSSGRPAVWPTLSAHPTPPRQAAA